MIPITAEHRARLAELAPAALERLEAFGYRERRECAWALIFGGLTPLSGLLVFDWPASAVAVVLCVNLAIALAGDWLRILLAPHGLAALSRAATHDEFVFRVASAIERGRRSLNPKLTPALEKLDQPDGADDVLVLGPIGFGSAFFAAWLVMADVTLHQRPATLVVGALPTLLVIVGAFLVEIARSRATLRETGSVRIHSARANASMVMMVGLFTVMIVGIVAPDPLMTPEDFVVLACIGITGVGLWRLQHIGALRRMAKRLRRRTLSASAAGSPR